MTSPLPASTEMPYPPVRYAWYVVGVLTFVYVFSFIDRQIMNLLVAPIRRDLHINDTQMSLLMGFTFAVFYTFFGIPLGRMADTHSRRGLVAAGFVVWSFFTAGCGIAKTFWQMMLMRIGVGVGEASLSPAAYSMISDYFPSNRRATALSVYGMGIYLGSGLASLLGGVVIKLASVQESWTLPLIGATYPWQIIFFAVGLPGVVFALLLCTVREPVRRGMRKVRAASGDMKNFQPPLREVFDYIKRNRTTFICHNIGISLVALASNGAGAWLPTFFIRTHHWTAAEIGIRLGAVIMVFGTLGIYCGGRFADYLASRGRRESSMYIMSLAPLLSLPFSLIYPLLDNANIALGVVAAVVFLCASPYGCAPAAITQIMPNSMRGQAAAAYLFVNNLIGLGFGPTAIAMVTDYFFHDDNMLRYSLLIVCVVAEIGGAIILRLGLKPFLKSLDCLMEYNSSHDDARPVC